VFEMTNRNEIKVNPKMVLFENVPGVLLLDDAQILDCLRSGSWRERIGG